MKNALTLFAALALPAVAAPQLPTELTVFFNEGHLSTPVNLGVVGSSGVGLTTLLTTPEVGSVSVLGMDVDRDAGYLYYARSGADLERIRFNGTGREVLYALGTAFHPQGVALDLANDRLFWVSGNGPTRIGTAELDGTGVQPLVQYNQAPPVVFPRSIDLDLAAEHVYWWEPAVRGFRRCDFDGSNLQLAFAVPGTGSVTNHRVDTVAGYYYWTILGELYRAPLAGGPPTLVHVDPDGFEERTLDAVPELDLVVWQVGNDRLRWTSPSAPGPVGESSPIAGVVGMRSLVAMPGPEVVLRIGPEPVPSGGPLEVRLLGAGPGSPFTIFLTSLNGSPLVLPAVSGVVDAAGEYSLSVPLGTGLSGASAEFVGVALDAAGTLSISLVEAVSFL